MAAWRQASARINPGCNRPMTRTRAPESAGDSPPSGGVLMNGVEDRKCSHPAGRPGGPGSAPWSTVRSTAGQCLEPVVGGVLVCLAIGRHVEGSVDKIVDGAPVADRHLPQVD